jgi:hypothetical protein
MASRFTPVNRRPLGVVGKTTKQRQQKVLVLCKSEQRRSHRRNRNFVRLLSNFVE